MQIMEVQFLKWLILLLMFPRKLIYSNVTDAFNLLKEKRGAKVLLNLLDIIFKSYL